MIHQRERACSPREAPTGTTQDMHGESKGIREDLITAVKHPNTCSGHNILFAISVFRGKFLFSPAETTLAKEK